jgi:Spy/CpxP family protein refolding chaperone
MNSSAKIRLTCELFFNSIAHDLHNLVIGALSLLGHINLSMAQAHVPVNAAGLGSRCGWPSSPQQQGGLSPGLVRSMP